MIDAAMTFICGRLNEGLQRRFGVEADLVLLSPFVDTQGLRPERVRNRLVMALSNVAFDEAQRDRRAGMHGEPPNMPPPVHLNLSFLVAAAHDADGYAEGLKLLSAALEFFQAFPVFTPQEAPGMPAPLSQLAVEPMSASADELRQIWRLHGGSYLPSTLFKLRGVVIDAADVSALQPAIPAVRGPGV